MTAHPFSSVRHARRLAVAVFAGITVVLLAGGYAYYRMDAQASRQKNYEELAAIAALKAGQVEEWRQERLSETWRVAKADLTTVAAISNFLAAPGDPGRQAELRECLKREVADGTNANFLLFDLNANPLFATGAAGQTVSATTRATVRAAGTNQEAVMSDFFRAANGVVYIDIAAAVTDGAGRPLAVLVSRRDPKKLLFPLLQTWPTPSRTAETVLSQQEGAEVVFVNPLRNITNAPMELRFPLTRTSLPAVQAALGKEGIIEGIDYRGVPVLDDLHHIPGTSWTMISKVDIQEVFAEARYRASGITLVIAMLLSLAAAGVAYFYRRRQVGILRNLYAAKQRELQAQEIHRATLYSIGDGVITTDADGRVWEMNPVAEELTGWTEAAAHGKPLEEVFRIVNEATREPVANPAQTVLHEHKVVDLANHTVLLARDGTEHPIAASAAPIRGADGGIAGVVLVFSDQTERHAARRAVEASEARWNFALEGAGDGVWDWNVATGAAFFSRQWKAMLGFEEPEIGDRIEEWEQRVHPEDLARCHADLEEYFSGKVPLYRNEHRMRCKNGDYKWILDRGKIVERTADGEPLRVIGTDTDISQRKQNEAALRASEERHRTILQTARDGIHILDSQGNVVEANAAFCAHLGYSREEILRLNLKDWDAQWSGGELLAKLRELIAAPTVFETRHRRKDGTLVDVEISAATITLGGQKHLYASARDITERKAAAAELRASAEKFRAIADNTAELELWFGLEGKILWVNPAVERITGYPVAEILGKPGLLLATVAAADRNAFIKHFHQAQQVGQGELFQFRCAHRNGNTVWLEAVWQPIYDTTGQALGLRASCRDITGRKAAEKSLNESSVLNASLLQTIPLGLEIVDETGAILFQNPALEQTMGRPVLGLKCWEVCRDDREQCAACPLKQPVKIGETKTVESAGVLGGRTFAITHTGMVYQGRPALLEVFQDITERKQAEAALRESEQRFHNLFHQISSVAIQGYAADGTTKYWNAAAERLYGYPAAEAIGKSLLDLIIPPEMRAGVMQAVRQMAATGQAIPAGELSLMRKDGSRVAVFSSHAVMQLPGQPPELFCIDIDLTARKQAERELRLQHSALEAAANAIVITDAQGRIEWINAAFTANTGYTFAEALGKNPRVLKSGKHPVAFYKNLWDTIRAGNVWHGEMVNQRKDGSLYTEDMTITPLKDEAGAVTHFIAIKQDITQRKLLEEQFRQSQKMEAFGQLAGGVAHDFNNILTVIQGNAALMQEDMAAADKEQALHQIVLSAKRAAALTGQLLAFSRRQIMQPRPVDLNEVVSGTGKMLQRLIGENIILHTQLLPGSAVVQADPGMIEQVLLNLAVNARDAMPAGGKLDILLENITVDAAAARRHRARPGDFIRLSVADSGAGIPPEVLPHIFEPFFTTKDVGKGTGLGLATVDGIVAQHHGWIEVESVAGRGTTFHLYLPRLMETQLLQAEEETTRPVRGGTETILLVEDEAALRNLAAHALENYGYHVLSAESGLAALELWRQHRATVDLLLTDLVMPDGVSGSELAVQLRADRPNLKVIYMSGYSGAVAGRGLDLREGGNFLAKPFVPAKLGQIVRDCLDAAPQR